MRNDKRDLHMQIAPFDTRYEDSSAGRWDGGLTSLNAFYTFYLYSTHVFHLGEVN